MTYPEWEREGVATTDNPVVTPISARIRRPILSLRLPTGGSKACEEDAGHTRQPSAFIRAAPVRPAHAHEVRND